MDWKGYLTTLICGCLLCAIVKELARGSAGEGILRLLCGVVLTLIAAGPLAEDVGDALLEDIQWEWEQAVWTGEDIYEEELQSRVRQELEDYIQARAAELGMELTARVTLGEDNLPREVMLYGSPSEKQRETMAEILLEDLGIEKERQLWIESEN